jgi:hypothetical protein
MSLLLLFRPKSGIGGEPEPEPPPVIVARPAGVKRRKKYIKLEDRETLEQYLRGELAKKFPEELPKPLEEQRAKEDRQRLKAQDKREAAMRVEAAKQAAAVEKKRKAVERHNRAVIALLIMALEDDDT